MEKVNGIPNHIGIIMDGNGRWAEKRGKKRSYGHKVGSDLVDKIATHAYSRGVKTVSLYAFSTENWARPKEEVDELMRLLKTYFSKFIGKVVKKKVRISVMGDISVLSEDLRKVIIDATEKTKDFTERTLNIGLNYGGRQEIVMAVKELIKD
jgi:undecaprenyl diphosphate synthase